MLDISVYERADKLDGVNTEWMVKMEKDQTASGLHE